MPTLVRASLDEVLTKRRGNVRSTPKGDAIFKAVSKAPSSWDGDARSAKFVMTSESVDRYGDIVRQAGINIENFLDNPQGLLFHDSTNWPIGTWGDITKILTGRPKRTEGVLTLLPAGKDPDADRAAVHIEYQTMRTVSIGFLPKDWEAIVDQETGYWMGYDFTESELVECSLVPIPAQPDALMKGANGDPKMLQAFVEDVLDNWVRTPEGVVIPRAEYEKLYQVTIQRIAPARKGKKQLELPVEPAAPAPAAAAAAEQVAQAEAAQAAAAEEATAELTEVKAADLVEFLAKAKDGDQIVFANDGDQLAGKIVLSEDGIYRAYTTGGPDRIEIHRDGGMAEMLPLAGPLAADAIAAIAARQRDVTKAPPAPAAENHEGDNGLDAAAPAALEADDEAAINNLLGGFTDVLKGIFSRRKAAPSERIEPVVDTAAPMPSAAAVATSLGKAHAIRARIKSNGLI
jgi:hypothetical protein